VEEKCKDRASRDFGDFSSEAIKDAVQRASPEQLLQLFENCQPAYPERTVDSKAVDRGRDLYTSLGCAFCHGSDIRGGNGGPSLLRSQLVMRDKQGETIADVIQNGRPNTAMPPFPLKSNQVADIAEFLHSFAVNSTKSESVSAASVVSGDAVMGEAFFRRHCSNCHSVTGDLKSLGVRYPEPRLLQQRWLMPQRKAPVTAIVEMTGGKSIEGELVRADEFRVVLNVREEGRHRVFERSGHGAQVSIKDPLFRHKELLSIYTDHDIHNVTSFLLTLRKPSVTMTQAAKRDAGGKPVPNEFAHGNFPGETSALTQQAILNPPPGSWPTYSGDYSGRRYSPLKNIDQLNVKYLTLAWVVHLTAGADDRGPHPVIIEGEGKSTSTAPAAADVRGSILQVDGVLYLSTPDNAWAIDARTGDILWHFSWKTRGAMRLGNRGLGMWGHSLFMATPDNYLISLDSRTGRKRWHVEIASFAEQYFSSSPAPIVVGDRVLVGTANLLNAPGFLKSFDAQTGKLQWAHYSVPVSRDDPGLESWKDLDAARHGGGMVWIPGSYDPDTNLYIYGTGNPTPAYVAEQRGNGDALFTCSLLAVNVDTGKRVWSYQLSPNDTHDWDAGLTPVLADISINGRTRKVVMAAARNGYFFVIDRTTGEHLLTSKFSNAANWAQASLNAAGQPVRIPAKDHHVSGALVSPANPGAANWLPASYSPDYELLYVPSSESWAVYYTLDPDAGSANSLRGKAEDAIHSEFFLKAISPKTGDTVWSVQYPSGGFFSSGVLTTAGRLLFAGDTEGNLVARDPANGTPIWHARLGKVSNAPQTYLIDGEQYVLVAASDTLYAFKLRR
jgi:alcohol dehydrogenase (cytochrome c)